MPTPFIGLGQLAPGNPDWATHAEANWVDLDKYIGQTIDVALDPNDVDDGVEGLFVGQILVQTSGGLFVKYFSCTVVGVPGTAVWVSLFTVSNTWGATQWGQVVETLLDFSPYSIDLSKGNYQRLLIDEDVTLTGPVGVPTIPNPGASFQFELVQLGDPTPYEIIYDAATWAFPFGGGAPGLSAGLNDIDMLYANMRFDGKLHASYSPLSV